MTKTKPTRQIDKFKEAARELETDDSEEAFDAKLKKIATTNSGKKNAPKGSDRD